MKLRQLLCGASPAFGAITLDAEEIRRRLIRRPSLGEVFAFAFGLAMAGVFIWLHQLGRVVLYDFDIYYHTASGNFANYYYAYWINPVFSLLAIFPFYAAYVIWVALSLGGVFFAARIFGSNTALIMLTYQMLYSVYYGQITGALAGGLGLMWFGLARRYWWLAGLGILIAGTKFQSGLIFAGLLLLYADIDWTTRLKTLIVPLIVFGLSLIIYPMWPLHLFQYLKSNPANSDGSMSLWRWFGPISLVVLIPAFVFRMPRPQRFLLLMAAVPLAIPYFQQADLLSLLVLPVGWLAILGGNIGFSYLFLGHTGLQVLFIVPLGLYIWALVSGLRTNRSISRGGVPGILA
jgi:hypothetical protein